MQLTERPQSLRALAPGIETQVEEVVMQALGPDPAARPSLRKIVVTLERAQARLIAAAGQPAAGSNVSVRPWRIAVASLGLAAFGLWTNVRRRRGSNGN
jgi:hypothetical protein